MLHDILIPSRIGTYYLQRKRVLSFEITPIMVQGLLIEFMGNKIQIKNKQSIMLKDLSAQTQINALKKIASNIGKYDEIISTLSGSAIVYKELKLPFIGRDALAMIVPYEVEALLPFALEESVIDFIVTKEDLEKKESKILVAAVRMQDLQNHLNLFEKAELMVDTVTIDIFALYEIYKAGISTTPQAPAQPLNFSFDIKSSSIVGLWHKLYAKFVKKPKIDAPVSTESPLQYQPKTAELFIDIGFDVVRALYFQDGSLTAVRMIPIGISDVAQAMSQKTEQPYFDIVQNILTEQSLENLTLPLHDELKKIFEEITRTLHFFEKQEHAKYIKPHKILFSGFATNIKEFHELAQTFFASPIEIVQSSTIIERLKITVKSEDQHFSIISLALGLFMHFEPDVNFLKSVAQKSDDALLNKQLLMIVFMTTLCLGATFWRSSMILQEKETAYNVSKRQLVQAIEQRMRLDLRGEKSIKTILEKAEEKLKTEKALWFAFSAQQEHSVLEYLQDLSVQIDRSAVGLQVKSMHLDYEKVSMSGNVKNFESLDLFEEELSSLQLLQLLEKPRELTFTVQFKPKENVKGSA
jgi:Tfp pilus assembly PilM family ATPase